MGWYGLLRDGRRTDGPLEDHGSRDFPFMGYVNHRLMTWAINGRHWGKLGNESERDIIAIIPPEAVEQEKAELCECDSTIELSEVTIEVLPEPCPLCERISELEHENKELKTKLQQAHNLVLELKEQLSIGNIPPVSQS